MYPDWVHRHRFRREKVNGKKVQSECCIFFSMDIDLIFLYSQNAIRGAPGEDFNVELCGCYRQRYCDSIAALLLSKSWVCDHWTQTLITIRSISLKQSQWNQQKYEYFIYKLIYYAKCKFSSFFL